MIHAGANDSKSGASVAGSSASRRASRLFPAAGTQTAKVWWRRDFRSNTRGSPAAALSFCCQERVRAGHRQTLCRASFLDRRVAAVTFDGQAVFIFFFISIINWTATYDQAHVGVTRGLRSALGRARWHGRPVT